LTANQAPSVGAESAAQGSKTEHNKQLVQRLFAIIYGTSLDDIALVDSLVALDYVQHQPRATQGREGLKAFLRIIVPEPKELSPKNTISVNYVAEGDYVVRQEIRKEGMLVDIFRVENGLLKEHWDAFRFAPGVKRIPGF
jgi:predicted SnoaL-like aldol condensation-catalyzing enzyme